VAHLVGEKLEFDPRRAAGVVRTIVSTPLPLAA